MIADDITTEIAALPRTKFTAYVGDAGRDAAEILPLAQLYCTEMPNPCMWQPVIDGQVPVNQLFDGIIVLSRDRTRVRAMSSWLPEKGRARLTSTALDMTMAKPDILKALFVIWLPVARAFLKNGIETMWCTIPDNVPAAPLLMQAFRTASMSDPDRPGWTIRSTDWRWVTEGLEKVALR